MDLYVTTGSKKLLPPPGTLCKKALFQQDASSKPVPYAPLLFSYRQMNLLTLP